MKEFCKWYLICIGIALAIVLILAYVSLWVNFWQAALAITLILGAVASLIKISEPEGLK